MARAYIDKNGYRRFADSDKPVHRWVLEKKFGTELDEGAVVHHKDRDKLNNNPDNLWAFRNQRVHNKIHKQDGW